MKRKKTYVIEKKYQHLVGKLFFNSRAWRKGNGIIYHGSMLCVLLIFNFGFWQTIYYTGVSSDPGQYAYHRMIVSSKLFTNDALQCAQRQNPYVKSELMTTRSASKKRGF